MAKSKQVVNLEQMFNPRWSDQEKDKERMEKDCIGEFIYKVTSLKNCIAPAIGTRLTMEQVSLLIGGDTDVNITAVKG